MMNRQEAQLTFWRVMARELGVGTRLGDALRQALTCITGSDLEAPITSIIAQVHSGLTLSSAMQQHPDFFSRAHIAMVRAGEVGGVMDISIRRLADALAEGTLSSLPAETPAHLQQAMFWWGFGCMLGAGVPILDAIDVAAETISDGNLRQAAASIFNLVRDGRPFSDAMRQFPGIFSDESIQAIAAAEPLGELDVAAMRLGDTLKSVCTGRPPVAPTAPFEPPQNENEPRVRKIVNTMLLQAIKDRATDLHLDPPADQQGRIRFRIDGALRDIEPAPSRDLYPMIVNRIKIMAGLDIAQSRNPQTGRILCNINNDLLDLRVSTMPLFNGERLAMRVFRRDQKILGLEAMCAGNENKLAAIRSLCKLKRGVVIATGPSGSGKTTLLYAMLQEANRPETCVVSIEDPVEIVLPGVAQIQVSPQSGMTYSLALRNVLRQDPDVIMVGEIRDIETLRAITVAAPTGHLVMTTLHTPSAPAALRKMLDVGLQPFEVVTSISAIVAQRLLRTLCPQCRQPYEPSLDTLPPEMANLIRQLPPTPQFYRPGRCPACHDTGYLGRRAIHEILLMTDPLRKAILANADTATLRATALASGMQPLLHDALTQAAQGHTSLEEVLGVLPSGEDPC